MSLEEMRSGGHKTPLKHRYMFHHYGDQALSRDLAWAFLRGVFPKSGPGAWGRRARTPLVVPAELVSLRAWRQASCVNNPRVPGQELSTAREDFHCLISTLA